MFDGLNTSNDPQGPDGSGELLSELERNTRREIHTQRGQERLEIKAKLIVRPGNTSSLSEFSVQGVTGDISEGGCRALMPVPLGVGDIYRLTFDQTMFDLPLVFARCVRCRLIREDAFEVGCTFLSPLKLSGSLKNPPETTRTS